MESDSLEVILALNHEIEEESETKFVLEDVVKLASMSSVAAFVKCPCASNSIAHHLARVVAGIRSEIFPSTVVVDGSRYFFGQGSSSSTLEAVSFFVEGVLPSWLSLLIRDDVVVPNGS